MSGRRDTARQLGIQDPETTLDLFFTVSKAVGGLLVPGNLIVILGVIAAGLAIAQRTRRFGKLLALYTGGAFLVLAIVPVGPLLLSLLERRFPSLEVCILQREQPIAGIIVLGGGVSPALVDGRTVDGFNEASDRVWYAASLARQFPDAPVVVSGGQAFDTGAAHTEAEAIASLLQDMGISGERIVLETRSRTTAENAAYTASLAGAGDWLLVTSAFHMPRAIGVFRKGGLSVIAAPTDWRVPDSATMLRFDAVNNLSALDLAVKEILGLFGYWIAGRSNEILPGPLRETCKSRSEPLAN
jgi:uncharacterized SAM-binding protein YcdF (DUF218 family)